MDNLEIKREHLDNGILLKCSGRLDANRAGQLNDYIDSVVREGIYFIALDLNSIEYLSSAGIRTLVTQYKNLKSINGHFYIQEMSDNVKQVLDMVGMENILTQKPINQTNKIQIDKQQNQFTRNDFSFVITPLETSEKTSLQLFGNPELVYKSAFKPENARKIYSSENHFSFGLGAIGNSFEECSNLFGEYLMLGKNIVYLPADGLGKPDYMVSSGQLVASAIELYGIHFDGNFSEFIRFEQNKNEDTIGLSEIADVISELSQYKQFAMVMIAESGGLTGTSLNISPASGIDIFSFPEIKNNIRFTTEPAHNKMLSVSAAFFSKEPGDAHKFLREIKPGSSIYGHVHSAVFPYVPLKKTSVNLEETVDFLINNTELTNILHLTYDDREIVGLGESQFVQGFCWIAPVQSIKFS